MSALLDWSHNDVKYWWTVVINKYYEWTNSDLFRIKNANSKFNVAIQRHNDHICVRVQKDNPEAGNATVRINVNDLDQMVIQIRDWKDECLFPDIPIYTHDNSPLKITIVCEVMWHGFVKEMPPPENLYDDVKQFLMNSELSDTTIVVANEEIPAHKIVLAAQSPVFLAMFNTNMTENRNNRVVIEGIDVDVMKKVLSYMYTGDIMNEQDVDVILQMMAVADKYQIDKLKKMCQVKLYNSLTIDNVLNIFEEASLYNAPELHEDAMKYMVNHRKEIVKLEHFKQLFDEKPSLFYEFIVRAAGK